MPLPALLDAQVLKVTRRRCLVEGNPRVVFGTMAAINPGRRPRGWPLNTSLVERVHLSSRQPGAAVGRRVATLCKGAAG